MRREGTAEKLMVIAAPKGAGKTTLLTNALRDKAPLFGPEADAAFQAIALPGMGKEFRLPTSEILRKGTWASNTHLAEIAQSQEPPVNLAVHLDLTHFCAFEDRPFESVLRVETNLHYMKSNPGAAIFARYKRLYVATLRTPYAKSAAWHKARAVAWNDPPSPSDLRLYSGTPEGVAAFDAIYEAWRRLVSSFNNLASDCIIDYDGVNVCVAPARAS